MHTHTTPPAETCCLDCWHAGEGTTSHCGNCDCCRAK